jgi:hypothetical protein
VVNPEQRDVLKLSYEKLRIADSRFVSNFKVQMVGNTDMGDFEFIYAGKSNPEKKKDVKIDGWKRRIIEHFMEIKP